MLHHDDPRDNRREEEEEIQELENEEGIPIDEEELVGDEPLPSDTFSPDCY
ncbi:hypothetical protein [Chitinophaga sp. MM2321]|uniref:hypothetical protein n=1 Tax=Chitinophaga sp. MM2321 TaxID=3137178 RepID=UPI0032D589F4